MTWITLAWMTAVLLVAAAAALLGYGYRKKLHVWMPGYVGRTLRRRGSEPFRRSGVIDVMFVFVDHFELAGKRDRLDAWMNRCPPLYSRHRDSDGFHPRHSWFYALDLMHEHEIESLGQLVDAGFGELELHWHHDHDDEASFTRKLRDGMRVFHRHGHMLPYRDDRAASFAFIHGNWSLDNSRGAEFCGVDNEIAVLLREGCYGDFTYPALFNDGQPAISNSIYYATDNGRPKSYNRGRMASAGRLPNPDELMIFQGPLAINWRDWRFRWHPAFEDGDINRYATHGDPVRIDAWMRQGIHVEGRPDWLFCKVFCHGAQDHASILGPATDKMFSRLESEYNDGSRFRLHYVTAREAFNIVRAAEDGKSGNPSQYRDYLIPTPAERRERLAGAGLHRSAGA